VLEGVYVGILVEFLMSFGSVSHVLIDSFKATEHSSSHFDDSVELSHSKSEVLKVLKGGVVPHNVELVVEGFDIFLE